MVRDCYRRRGGGRLSGFLEACSLEETPQAYRMKAAVIAVICLASLGSAEARLGNKLADAEKAEPSIQNKEWQEYGRKFVVRSGKSKEDGTGFAKLYLDGELVETSFFFDDPKKCWGEKEMKGIWKHNFGEEQIEETRKKDGLTTWSGQNGGLASFGVLKGKNGGETGFALLSSAKMKVVRDKYYQAELAKIPAPKPKEKDDGPKITFGGKKRDRGTGQLRVVGGSVYDGPEYIGYTSGDYIYINK